MNMLFMARRLPWTDGIDLSIGVRRDGRLAVARNLEFAEQPENSICDPLLKLSPNEAQALADALYEVGVRPTAAAGSAGQLAAVQYHLEDLRTLVFKPRGAA